MKPKTNFEKVIESLTPEHQDMLSTFEQYAIARACQSTLPEAEAMVLETLVRAVVSFRSPCPSAAERREALFFWIRKKTDYALLNLAAKYPFRDVRDAFVEFETRFGHKPTLRELCRFSRRKARRVKGVRSKARRVKGVRSKTRRVKGVRSKTRRVKSVRSKRRPLTPRQVLNVWEQVAVELGLTPATDTVMQGLLDEVNQGLLGVLNSEAMDCERVRKALALLAPADSCLIILKDMCDYHEKQILLFFKRARSAASRSATQDDMEEQLDKFVHARVDNLAAPWDSGLLEIRKRGHLATRLHRARARFRIVYRRLDRSG